MSEDLPPSLFKILREDNSDFRQEINKRLDGIARDSVSAALFAAAQNAQKERDDRQDSRIKELEEDKDRRDGEIRKLLEDAKKSRAQLFTSLGLAVFASVLATIGGVVVWTLQTGLSQLAGVGAS